MNTSKLVSVIMCVYNTPQEYLIEAVLSILNQSYKKIELIIVDDNSDIDLYTDKIFEDKRIIILRNSENYGPSFSRNKALHTAKGEYIAILDSDDISFNSRIEKQVDFLETHIDFVACGTWFRFFGDKNHDVKRIIDNYEYFRCCLLFDNSPTLLNSSMMIRKSTLDEFNISWDERLRIGEDYFMWVQLLEHGKITNINEVLVLYRVHEKQSTSLLNRNQLNCNTWLIKEYQFKKIGLNFELGFDLLLRSKGRTINKIKKINSLLTKIINANESSNYFDQTELIKRCDKKIEDCIFSISNPFSLLFLSFYNEYRKYSVNAMKYKMKKWLRTRQKR